MDGLVTFLSFKTQAGDVVAVKGALDLMLHATRREPYADPLLFDVYNHALSKALMNVVANFPGSEAEDCAMKVVYSFACPATMRNVLRADTELVAFLERHIDHRYAMLTMVMLFGNQPSLDRLNVDAAMLDHIYLLLKFSPHPQEAIEALRILTLTEAHAAYLVVAGPDACALITDAIRACFDMLRAQDMLSGVCVVARLRSQLRGPSGRDVVVRLRGIKTDIDTFLTASDNVVQRTASYAEWREVQRTLEYVLADSGANQEPRIFSASGEAGKAIEAALVRNGFQDEASLELLWKSDTAISRLGIPIAHELRLKAALDKAFEGRCRGAEKFVLKLE